MSKSGQNIINVLGANWAQNILNLEQDLESHCNLQNLQALMSLYSEVIEYFDRLGDSRYVLFQERMHSVLTRQEVLTLVSGQENKQAQVCKEGIGAGVFDGCTQTFIPNRKKATTSRNTVSNKLVLKPCDEEEQHPLTKIKTNDLMMHQEKKQVEKNKKKRDTLLRMHLAKQTKPKSPEVISIIEITFDMHQTALEIIQNDFAVQENQWRRKLQQRKEKVFARAIEKIGRSEYSLDSVTSEQTQHIQRVSIEKLEELSGEENEGENPNSKTFHNGHMDSTASKTQKSGEYERTRNYSIASDAMMTPNFFGNVIEDEFESALVEIYECWIRQKVEKQAEVRRRYKAQLEEYEGKRNPHAQMDFYALVIDSMQEQMQEELDDTAFTFDVQCKKAIRDLRIHYRT